MEKSIPRSLRLLVVLSAGLVVLGLTSGCSQRQELAKTASPQAGFSEAASLAQSDERAAANEPAPGRVAASSLPTQLPSQRMVIRTANLEVRVRDVASAADKAVQLTESQGGYVQSSSQESSGGDRADLTLRVDPGKFLPLVSALEGLGILQRKSASGEDVTEEYYDLDARLGNLNAVRARLLNLLARAAKVTDAIEVERELERVGAELNRIEGRMKFLTTMVGLSTINLTLSTEERPAAEPFINWAFVGNGFVVSARFLVQAFFFILQAIVVVVPIAVVVGAAAYGIWRLVRLLRRRSGGKAATPARIPRRPGAGRRAGAVRRG